MDASLMLEIVVAALGHTISAFIPFSEVLLRASGFGLSFAITTILFGVIYRVLPSGQLSWREIVGGALLTSILFMIGKVAIRYYLASRSAATTLGAGGALIGLLLWVYYSSIIFLYGAAVVAVWNERNGASPSSAMAEEPCL